MPRQLMLELEQLRLKVLFQDYVTIEELRSLSKPRLARSTIINAILRGRLDAQQKDGENGWYLIHFPSARKLWSERFTHVQF